MDVPPDHVKLSVFSLILGSNKEPSLENPIVTASLVDSFGVVSRSPSLAVKLLETADI